VAELQVLIGAWKTFPTFAVLAGLGVLVGVAYTLRAIRKAFYGESANETANAGVLPGEAAHASFPSSGGNGHVVADSEGVDPISVPERIGAAILMATTLLIGLYPRLLLDWIVPALNSPLFDGMRTAAGE
jgi:NADH-quinone oxidoreductase subunit M